MTRTHETPGALRTTMAYGAVYLIWGSTYLAIKLVSQHGAFVLAGTRFLTAGTLLLAFAWWRGDARKSDFAARSWLNAAIVGTCLMLLGNGGVAIATKTVDSGLVALMTAVTPLWLVGLDSMMHRTHQRPGAIVWLGIAMGIAGVVVLKFGDFGGAAAVSTIGVVVMLVATLGWAMGSVWSKRPGSAHSPLVATAMQMLAGGVVLVLASFPKEWISHDEWTLLRTSPPDLTTWLWWSYLVVFGSLCGFTAYIWLLRNQPAARVATYAYVNPLVAIALGWLLLSEPIGVRTFAAAGLMLGGVAVIQLAKARKTMLTRAPIAAE
ncbi:MAG: EamA family transporter [Limnohabitans sp.]|nr:EamA family transporter [Limnohabitans sp.]